MNSRLHEAIMFATKAHNGQVRKGSPYPYIIHPMEVLQILTEMRMPEEVLMAGVLHDTVEDTDTTLEDIERTFGRNVAELVGYHTEDKSKTWQERKENGIREIHDGSTNVRALVLADKLANLRSLADDVEAIGEDVWSRFNAPYEKQKWYYGAMVEEFSHFNGLIESEPYYEELKSLYQKVFG